MTRQPNTAGAAVAVVDEHVRALRRGRGRSRHRDLQLSELVVAMAAEHDHRISQRELRVGDGSLHLPRYDEVFLESEGLAQPIDGSWRVVEAHRRDDRGLSFRHHRFPPGSE